MLRSLGIALLCLTALVSSRAKAEAHYVIVQRGDALSLIAERAKVSVAQLREWNQLDGDLIRIGQKLIIGRNSQRAHPESVSSAEKEPPSGKTQASGSYDDGIDWTPPFDYAAAAAEVEMKADEDPAPRIAARDPATAVAARAYDKPVEKKTVTKRLPGAERRHAHGNRPEARDDGRRICWRPTLGLDASRFRPGRDRSTWESRCPAGGVPARARGHGLGGRRAADGVSSRDLQRCRTPTQSPEGPVLARASRIDTRASG